MAPPIDRRQFLALCAAGSVVACARGARAPAGTTRGTPGIQLYTVRKELASDFDGTLARVAEIGYREVEFAGYFKQSPAAVRAALSQNGLRSPASHVGSVSALPATWDRTLGTANEVGHQWVVCSWIDQGERTPDHYRRHADTFNALGNAARRAGLRFAYHTHDFVFPPIDGVRPFDLLLERTDPAAVDFELDIYWVIKGGADPLTYLRGGRGRFPLLHVKDMNRDGTEVDVGAGVVDFRGLFAHGAQAGTRHYFMERDEPSPDGLTSARRSLPALTSLLRNP